jgi:hypothetical protein
MMNAKGKIEEGMEAGGGVVWEGCDGVWGVMRVRRPDAPGCARRGQYKRRIDPDGMEW